VKRFAWLAVFGLAACATAPMDAVKEERSYSGTVQKVFHVVRRGADLPGMRFFGKIGSVLAPALRQNAETHQYIVGTPSGQIIAQSDREFPVGGCVRVIPQNESSGPTFGHGDATVVPCN
jgi:hypothetical protein